MDIDAIDRVFRAHMPELTDDDERVMYMVLGMSMVSGADLADLAKRTCSCGVSLDGFYEYTDHLKEEFGRAEEAWVCGTDYAGGAICGLRKDHDGSHR